MRKLNFIAWLCILLICAAGMSGAQEPKLSAGVSPLKKNGKSKLRIEFVSPESDWNLRCSGVELTGWASPLPVNIVGRNSETGYYNEVTGKQFTAGMKVSLQLQRMPGTTKDQVGECRLQSTSGGSSKESTVSFKFR